VPATVQVQGQQLEKVEAPAAEDRARAWWLFVALILPFFAGAARQVMRRR
jgi:hypothetical protein